MTRDNRASLGHRAEERAAAWLTRRGYRVLARRYRREEGEIDLIACSDSVLCFIEVKARADDRRALEAVQPRQRRRIEAAATRYLAENPATAPLACRFDVITLDRQDNTLHHLPDAWRVGE